MYVCMYVYNKTYKKQPVAAAGPPGKIVNKRVLKPFYPHQNTIPFL